MWDPAWRLPLASQVRAAQNMRKPPWAVLLTEVQQSEPTHGTRGERGRLGEASHCNWRIRNVAGGKRLLPRIKSREAAPGSWVCACV